MAEQTQREDRWIEGKNGGRLRPGTGTPGPRRATVAVRSSVVEALRDPRGGAGKEFWIKLKTGSAEDRRTFASVASRLIPVEVQGDLAASLTVHVQTLTLSDEHKPMQGTCVIGKNGKHAPLPAPIEGETVVIEDAKS